tara:strand:- start:389 stop:1792 length:1404 start_codon:yes stop_codon:yes gene_type:complete
VYYIFSKKTTNLLTAFFTTQTPSKRGFFMTLIYCIFAYRSKLVKRLIIILLIFPLFTKAQCLYPTNLSSSNVNYYNATVNWTPVSGVYSYKIRYKIVGASSWSYKNNVNPLLPNQLLAGLQPLSDYVWHIRSHCDSTNTNNSQWSPANNFTTNNLNCPAPTNLNTSNVNYNNAVANWGSISTADRYKIHYRIYGTSTWFNLGPVYSPNTSILMPQLQQNTTYEWQAMAYYDSTTLLASLWSVSDTFTTSLFVAAPFNPIVNNTLSNLQCNTPSELTLIVTQAINEPDIGETTITSSDGYFNFNSINTGDSVGYANMTTATQSISSTLRAGLVFSNFAIINAYDSTGSLIGFFTLENNNVGIKVSSTSPNDQNNYTSGLISEIKFVNLFVNPPTEGELYFYIDIESELGDLYYSVDTVDIWCNTTSMFEEHHNIKNPFSIDLLGRKNKNQLLFYISKEGRLEKRIKLH